MAGKLSLFVSTQIERPSFAWAIPAAVPSLLRPAMGSTLDEPIFYVEWQPTAGSPAALAGLRAGDAVLRFGEATAIGDVPALLQPKVPISLTVMRANGIVRDGTITPRVFDRKKPKSLLGCQITDVCPAKFPHHPALRRSKAKAAAAAREEAEEKEHTEETSEQDGRDSRGPGELSNGSSMEDDDDDARRHRGRAPAPPPQWLEDDSPRRRQDDVRGDSPELPGAEEAGDFREASRGHDAEPGRKHIRLRSGGDGGTSWLAHCYCRSRAALLLASLLHLGHACVFLAAPSLESQEFTSVFHTFQRDLWRLATSECTFDPGAEGRRELVAVTKDTLAEIVDAQEASAEEGEAELEDDVIDEGADDEAVLVAAGGLTLQWFARAVVVAGALQLALTVTGMWLALTPRATLPQLNCCLLFVYPPTALLLWLLLAGATMYCIVFRMEADELLWLYRKCLDGGEGGAGAGAIVFESVTAAAMVCATADFAAVFGLVAACFLLGWRNVLRAGLKGFSALTAVLGGLLLPLGFVLKTDDILPLQITSLAATSGAAMLLLGFLGMAATRREHVALLWVYSLLLAAGSLLLAILCASVVSSGGDTLRTMIARVGALGSATASDEGGHPVRETAVEKVVELVQAHRFEISAGSIAGIFLLVTNLAVALAFARIVAHSGRGTPGAQGEYASVGVVEPSPLEEAVPAIADVDEEMAGGSSGGESDLTDLGWAEAMRPAQPGQPRPSR